MKKKIWDEKEIAEAQAFAMKAIPPRGFGKPKRKAVEIGGKSGWNLGGMWVVCGR